ncbi:MAG: glycosyltransferase [Chitinophagales bacterium]|nr:glycosyltransferase [Hyphomicrobiales bacterium]
MRIVQALGSSRKGGAEQFFIRLVDALNRQGVQQRVLVRGGHWAQERLEQVGVKTDSVWFGGKLDIFTRAKFKRVLAEHEADLAITWMRRAASACPSGPWMHVARLGNYYKMSAFKHCDHLIGITPGIVDYIKKAGWPADRVTFIPNFVPAFEATPTPRATLNTPEDAPLIVWLGRMAQDKGPDIVVNAMKEVPGAYVWMAGDGAFEKEVKELAGRLDLLDRVRFLGWRDDIHSLLEAADIYVCASRFEAHGNIVLEAWAHGLPIVSARSPGPEHLIAHGETGLLVANDNPADMAQALNQLISDKHLQNRLGKAGWVHFNQTYSETAVTAMYHDLFSRMKAQGKRRAA